MIYNVFISFLVMLIMYMLLYMVSYNKLNEAENISTYECGYDGMISSRMMFSYRFFLISILFLVFDVEIVLLIPFTFLIQGINEMYFIMILLVGLIYELFYGSLDWL